MTTATAPAPALSDEARAALSPAALDVLFSVLSGRRTVVFNVWLRTAGTVEKIGDRAEPVALEVVDELLAAGALQIARSVGTLFVCVLPGAVAGRFPKLTALYGLPERYWNCVHPDAKLPARK